MPTGGPLYDELTGDGRALLISPSPRRGLQPEHLDTIERFTGYAASNATAMQADALLRARRMLGDDSTAS